MARRMLIDAAHPEETRVVVLSGSRLDEFDFESSTKKQVKGNIYLAKVTRVEPSLQAAFVDYGGNRHGFLAFDEIHPDYYRIPVGDRSEFAPPSVPPAAGQGGSDGNEPDDGRDTADPLEPAPETALTGAALGLGFAVGTRDEAGFEDDAADEGGAAAEGEAHGDRGAPESEGESESEPPAPLLAISDDSGSSALAASDDQLILAEPVPVGPAAEEGAAESETIETLGGDEIEEAEAERPRARPSRHYKIQEVIKRRQIMLVQVVKEERGNKGAALTTYLSLAGRYCVLMPNTGRGGGVSRKITSMGDRRRLKDILEDLDIPAGMGVIVRTAGAERSKAEIKRDYEYLLRLWTEIRELTLQSSAPALIYEEGNLIKRSIRDLYARDIDEVQVEGEEGYRTAKAFMRMLMPSHAKRVRPYRDERVGLFHHYQVESQIDAIHSPVVQLRSGGYVVINQAEALVAIDVNSGRATRERNIEETALRTNLEAAEEIARQLRLRDLAGLIVIDFIDMEEHRNNGAVERRLKEALKNDRARIQVGRISPFGLLEMSRQRLRPSLAEASTQPCPHCAGTGLIRSTESTALYVLRSIEEEGMRQRAAEICIYVPTAVALYLLNQKRESLAQIEARYGIRILVDRDDALVPPNFRLERVRLLAAGEVRAPRLVQSVPVESEDEEEEAEAEAEAGEIELAQAEPVAHAQPPAETPAHGEDERGRRRRRRRRRRSDDGEERRRAPAEAAAGPAEAEEPAAEEGHHAADGDGERRRRRRGRRGGRWRSRREEGAEAAPPSGGEPIDIVPPSVEPLPAEEPVAAAAAADEAPIAMAFATDAEAPHRLGEPDDYATAAPEMPEVEAEPETEGPGGAEREPEPALAAEGAAHAAPSPPVLPGADVHEVSAKPANPRRGWWQRLIDP